MKQVYLDQGQQYWKLKSVGQDNANDDDDK